ncbi:TauD/TfdA family dioxygenase [Thalassovita mangrovi]
MRIEDSYPWIRETPQRAGVAVLRNLPIADPSEAAASHLLAEFGLSFGCPVSQSDKFDFLGHVTDRGSNIRNHAARGYESSAELPFHNDRCDLLALLCIRQAPIGGETDMLEVDHLGLCRLCPYAWPEGALHRRRRQPHRSGPPLCRI